MSSGKRFLLYLFGTVISVGAPAAVTVCYFPLWHSEGGGAALSGFTLFILLICSIPLLKLITRVFSTPSAPVVWLFVFIFFLLFERIAKEVTVIALAGTVSNVIGAILFKAADHKRGISDEKS